MKTKKYNLLLIGLLVLFSPLVIYGFRLCAIIYPTLWVGIPLFLYSLLPKRKSMLLSIFIVLIAIAYSLYSAVSLLGFVFCGYRQNQFNYINTDNRNIKLIGRDYSCYGTTGDLVLYKEFTIIKGIKVEVFYKKFIDYKNIYIDTTKWKPLKSY